MGADREAEDVQGKKLLTAVERLLAETGALVAQSNEALRRAKEQKTGDAARTRLIAARDVVKRYATLSAVSGGATALPALLPGVGTVTALTGGLLADVAMILKFEVEMALVLTHLYGGDIYDPKVREEAFLLASISTYELKSGRNFFVDVAQAQGEAVLKYAPREAGKLLVVALARIATLGIGKGLARAIPLVGIAVGASFNRVLTARVGERIITELSNRPARDSDEDVVDAKVSGG